MLFFYATIKKTNNPTTDSILQYSNSLLAGNTKQTWASDFDREHEGPRHETSSSHGNGTAHPRLNLQTINMRALKSQMRSIARKALDIAKSNIL